MYRVTAVIRKNDRGRAVQNLQSALLLLLAREGGDANRQALMEQLLSERRDARYGEATVKSVAEFQSTHHLDLTSGEQVNAATADALNRELSRLSAFEPTFSEDYIVTGRVEFEDGSPAAGMRVEVFDRDLGAARTPLGNHDDQVVTGPDGAFGAIRYHKRDFAEKEEIAISTPILFSPSPPSEMRRKLSRFIAKGTLAAQRRSLIPAISCWDFPPDSLRRSVSS